MRVTKMKLLALAMVFSLAQPALADKGGKGHKPEQAAALSGESKGKGSDENFLGFNDDEVKIITGILRGLYGGGDEKVEFTRPSGSFCPPGLAKKNNGCMPPGQAKKYAVGQRLPDNVTFGDLPRALRDALGVPPQGKKYVRVDNDILLIESATKLVLDAIGVNRK